MNYRRGLQRVSAVLAIAWVAGVLFALPADRVRFWRKWDVFDEAAAHPCAPTPCSEQELKVPWIAARMDQEARLAEQKPKVGPFYEYMTCPYRLDSD